MSDSYTLTVHIALRGTPLLNRRDGTPTGKTSIPGHMWYSIQKGDGPEQSYGFQPKISLPVGPGEVVDTDNATYYKPRHERTMEITREQYDKLKEFGQNGKDKNWDFFKDTNFRRVYSAGDNSCIDFTWFALRHAGLEWQEPEKDHPTPIEASGFEGKVYPGDNWDYIQRIKAPFPDSQLNRIHEGPTPKDAQAELLRKEQAEAFKQDPEKALERFPEDTRLQTANEALAAVDQKYAGSRKGNALVAKMQHYLAGRIEQDAALPTPQQALGMAQRALGRAAGHGY